MDKVFKFRLKVLYYLSIAFLFSIIVIVGTCISNKDKEYSKKYFRKLKLELQGVVTDKLIFTNDGGLFFIDVKNTNLPHYDLRSTDSVYYCLIKNGKAELIEGGLSDIKIGDSVVVNSNDYSFSFYRNGGLRSSHPLSLRQSGTVFFNSKNQHRLK